jgi:hypothetical protein
MSKVTIESKNYIFNFNDMYIFYDNNPGHRSWDEHRRRAAGSQQLRSLLSFKKISAKVFIMLRFYDFFNERMRAV